MAATLKVGIAGLGSVSRTVLGNVNKISAVKLTAVADLRREPLDRAASEYGVETFTRVETMCASPNVDAIWVCTPNQFHAEHTIMAAESGKHLINEKPMALSLEQAQTMVDAVERNGVRYVQGHSNIFDPSIRKMREVVSSGELGQLVQPSTWEHRPWISGQPRIGLEVDVAAGGGGCSTVRGLIRLTSSGGSAAAKLGANEQSRDVGTHNSPRPRATTRHS
jgi:phthalate 4,5-cis-dihydrodiol dehydrogenase